MYVSQTAQDNSSDGGYLSRICAAVRFSPHPVVPEEVSVCLAYEAEGSYGDSSSKFVIQLGVETLATVWLEMRRGILLQED